MYQELMTCPCCGYKTISDEHEHCPICFWQYNDYQLEHPDEGGGPNSVSLREAQQNYAFYGAKTKTAVDSVRAPDPNDVRDPKWRPMDSMNK